MRATLLKSSTALAGVPARQAAISGLPIPKSIASRTGFNFQAGGYAGTTTGETLLQDHLCLANCDGIRIVYVNSFGGGRVPNINSIMVGASVIDASGRKHQVTFDGGGLTLKPIAFAGTVIAISDVVPIGFNNGSRFSTRTFVKVTTNGDTIPDGAVTRNSPYVDGVASGDQTMAASPTFTTDGSYHFGPAAILADYVDAPCVVGLLLDSITAGQNDGNANVDQIGWALRALNNRWPYLNMAIPGDSCVAFRPPIVGGGATSREPRIALAGGVTHCPFLGGTNDLAGATLATLQDSLLANYRALAMRGIKVIACTIPTGGVTSTDGYTTLVNQTVPAHNAVRVPVNGWIRDGAPISPATGAAVAVGTALALRAGQPGHPLVGYWELADSVESARDSGKWRVDLGVITDGTHPNATGSALMAAAADLTLLGPAAPGAIAPVVPASPSSIFGANLFGWWKASAITGKVDGDAISSWPDSSGNGRSLIQATSGNQPVYKTNINYSLPAVRFDGVDDWIKTAAFGTLAQPYEIIVLGKYRTTTVHSSTPYMIGTASGTVLRMSWDLTGAGTPRAFSIGSTGGNLGSGLIADPGAAWHAYEGLYNGAGSAIYEDGVSIAAGNAGTGSITSLVVGAASDFPSNPADVDVQEVLIVNRALTTQERFDLHVYFVSTYATP